eukprot:97564_1
MSSKHYYDIVWIPSRSDQKNQIDGMHQIHRVKRTDEPRYSVTELIAQRKHNLKIDCSQLNKLPRSICFVTCDVNKERCMEDVTAMFIKKSATPCSHTGKAVKAPTQRQDTLIKQLTVILNRMTPQKLMTHAVKFDFRTRVLVDMIKEMRRNEWKHRLKTEVAKTIDAIKADSHADFNDRGGRDTRSNRRDRRNQYRRQYQ